MSLAPTFIWEHLGHVDPPPAVEESIIVQGSVERETFSRSLTFYLGPNHYPAGIYLPEGHDLESRPADDEGWTIVRAVDSVSGQTLTLWALRNHNDDGTPGDGDQVKILDP